MSRTIFFCTLALCGGGFMFSAAALADDQLPQPKGQIDKGDASVPDKIAPNNQPQPVITTKPTHCELAAPSQNNTDASKSKTDKSCDS
jgi:hypothetical protein